MQYMQLTPADRKVNLLAGFAKFGFLSFDEACAIQCGNIKTTRSDLAYLFRQGLLAKRKITGFRPDIIFITKKGASFVSTHFETGVQHYADYAKTSMGRAIHRVYTANIMLARRLQITARRLEKTVNTSASTVDALSKVNRLLTRISLVSELDFYADKNRYICKGKLADGLIVTQSANPSEPAAVTWIENEKTPKGQKQFRHLITFLAGIRLDKRQAVQDNSASQVLANIPLLHGAAQIKSVVFYINTSPFGAGDFEARLKNRLDDETYDYLSKIQMIKFMSYQISDYLKHKTPTGNMLATSNLIDKNFSLILN
ncbi:MULTISPECIES: hypothetical protein [Deefgea]|uniref:Uncharacterized protein n=1 Tax=Deefgea chitinilytica TaxID=570276 RepID=A0ABS2CDY2_9NEIS|nr:MULTISPECIES: hypothetical protein [Deefgea]MBM5572324.1 hypothetical protein [Deefgea chitinilytica]MBM9889560.1 hypothetical protein [Deefgea sp. CFH1-16]